MATRHMTCCVCGDDAGTWKQHWNRDTGFGICVKCVTWLRDRKTPETEIANLYGKQGLNWGCAPINTTPVYAAEGWEEF